MAGIGVYACTNIIVEHYRMCVVTICLVCGKTLNKEICVNGKRSLNANRERTCVESQVIYTNSHCGTHPRR